MDKEEECLKDLQDRIKESPELDSFSSVLTDRFLLHFIRGRKYNITRAFETLQGYLNIRRGKHRAWFKSIRPRNFLSLAINPMRVLKHRDHLNRLVVLIEFRHWEPRELPIDEALKLTALSIDEVMDFEDAEKNGAVLICDFSMYSLQHAKNLTPSAALKALQLFWNNTPLRYKTFHMVNEIYLFTMMFKGIKPILPKKLKDRLYFHSSDYKSLHESVSPEILPKSLWGSLSDEAAFDEGFMERIFRKEDYYDRFAKIL